MTLARRVLTSTTVDTDAEIVDRLEEVKGLVGRLPGRDRASVCTMPSSFRSFDQRPEDVLTLVERLIAVRGYPEAPVVVGVRTSGAYLAPLALAALEARGVEGASIISMRPGAHLNPYALSRVRARGAESSFLIVDDPPSSGSALAAVARGLRRFVADADKVTFLVATITEDGSLPQELDDFPRVTLPWEEWKIHSELAVPRLEGAITSALSANERVVSLEIVGPVALTRREHVRVTVRATVATADGDVDQRLLAVRGVGLGYLGRDALRVAEALGGLVSRPLAMVGALLVEEPLDGDGDAPPPSPVVVKYLARRAATLGVARDRSGDRGLSASVSGVASLLMVRSLGPRASLVAARVLGPAVRLVLRAEHPAVIDGAIGRQHWGKREGRWAKRDYADGAFSNRDLACYDLAFDLASSAVDGDSERERTLRALYAEAVGDQIDECRWLLYTLVALWDRHRAGELDRFEYSRRQSAAVVNFLSEVYLGDLAPVHSGPVVALDLDGVLETSGGSYSAPGRLGMVSLRALLAHGYQVIVATGRSATEVVDRVRPLRLAGGVAEYGSAIVTADGDVHAVIDAGALDAISHLRTRIAALNEIDVDPGFSYSIRASHKRHLGRLSSGEMQQLVRCIESDGRADLQLIRGDNQVDLVDKGVNKAAGVAALIGRDGSEGPLVRLAMGDTAADRPLLERAERAVVPRNAVGELRRDRFTVTAGRFQAGVVEAVTREIGHRPGECSICRLPSIRPEADLIAKALSLAEAGTWPGLLRTSRLLLWEAHRRG